jgi:hypothetical protein
VLACLFPNGENRFAESFQQDGIEHAGEWDANFVPSADLPSGGQTLFERYGIAQGQEQSSGIDVSHPFFAAERRLDLPQALFVIAPEVTDAPIEFTEQPLVCRRQYHQMTAFP